MSDSENYEDTVGYTLHGMPVFESHLTGVVSCGARSCPKFNRCLVCRRNMMCGFTIIRQWMNWSKRREILPITMKSFFAGMGESTTRLDDMLEVARRLREKGAKLRLNTNGLGSMMNGRDVAPEIAALIPTISCFLKCTG